MRRTAAMAAALLVLQASALPQETAPPAPAASARTEEFPFEDDHASAKERAAKEKRGLFILLTAAGGPDGVTRKVRETCLGDPEIRKYVLDRFVPVLVEDGGKEPFASGTLRLLDRPHPNVALYDAAGEYFGRLTGFAGKDLWFAGLRKNVERGERIAALRPKAAGDPAAGNELAGLLAEVPDLEKAAEEALERVPPDRRDPAVRAKVRWNVLGRSINFEMEALLRVPDPKDPVAAGKAKRSAYLTMAPKVRDLMEAFLREFPASEQAPEALATEVHVFVQAGLYAETIETGKRYLAKYPDGKGAKVIRAHVGFAETNLGGPGTPPGGGGDGR